MTKPAIPSVPGTDPRLHAVLAPMKENIERLTGIRGGPIASLATDATLAEAVTKINEIIDRLNA